MAPIHPNANSSNIAPAKIALNFLVIGVVLDG